MNIDSIFRYAGTFATILVLALSFAPFTAAQDKKGTDREAFVEETLGFLRVGVADHEIRRYWDKNGWPKSIQDLDFVLIRNAKAQPKLLAKLRTLLVDNAVLSELAEEYQTFKTKLGGGMTLELLRPRGWDSAKSSKGDRFSFHEHSADLPGWFRRTSLFVWVFDGGNWTKRNDKALTRIVLTAAKKRLERSGLFVGTLKEGRLLVKREKREFPVMEAICKDPKDKLKGVVAMTTLVDEKAGKVVVVGYTARLNPAKSKQNTPRELLTQMVSSLSLKKSQ